LLKSEKENVYRINILIIKQNLNGNALKVIFGWQRHTVSSKESGALIAIEENQGKVKNQIKYRSQNWYLIND
jgi:hypothetical protein